VEKQIHFFTILHSPVKIEFNQSNAYVIYDKIKDKLSLKGEDG